MNGSVFSLASTDDALPLPRHRWTATDVRAMIEAGVLPDKAPIELIDGELIDMPSEGRPHWDLKTEMVTWFIKRLPSTVRLAPDGPLRLSERNEPEPDFFLFPASMRVNAVRGPDALLVVEIADSSLRKDTFIKAPLYAAHGVPEYWVIDLEGRRTLAYRLADGAYGEPARISFDGALAAPEIAEPLVVGTLLAG